MFFNGDFQVKETKTAYIVSVIGEKNSVRITKEQVKSVDVNEEPEMVAILLGIIEFQRINERAFKRSTEYLIKDEEVLGKINFLIETRRTPIDEVINILSQMKYFEMKNFFNDFEKSFFTEEDYI